MIQEIKLINYRSGKGNKKPLSACPACPVQFFAEDERSEFNWGRFGKSYWGDLEVQNIVLEWFNIVFNIQYSIFNYLALQSTINNFILLNFYPVKPCVFFCFTGTCNDERSGFKRGISPNASPRSYSCELTALNTQSGRETNKAMDVPDILTRPKVLHYISFKGMIA